MVAPLRKNNPRQVPKPKKNVLPASYSRSSSSFGVKKDFGKGHSRKNFVFIQGHLHGLKISLRLAGTVIPCYSSIGCLILYIWIDNFYHSSLCPNFDF